MSNYPNYSLTDNSMHGKFDPFDVDPDDPFDVESRQILSDVSILL